ncbi:hypothetical protein LSAT2_004089 [Lamellibrachia satsuma]|nr:hypothetical protein LSAT2_004089 [Lamellibrachia satsuma]
MAFRSLRAAQNSMRQVLSRRPTSTTEGVSTPACRSAWTFYEGGRPEDEKRELTEKEKKWKKVEEHHSKLEDIYDPTLRYYEPPVGATTMPAPIVFSQGYEWQNVPRKKDA